MPYTDISQLPKYVKKYSERIQRQFMHVFNSVYEKVLKETGDKTLAEKRGFMAANSVLKRRMERHGAYGINNHSDWFSYQQDLFLKNL